MAEKLDLYDIDGNKLGKTIVRGEKPAEGQFIKLVVVYIKSGDKYLLQKCSKEKGGEFAVTGGHVSAGNTSEEQVQIEIKEELGVDIDVAKLKRLGNIYRRQAMFDVYLYEDENFENVKLKLQTEEVEGEFWLAKTEIEALIEKGLVRERSCQHYDKFIR